MSKIPTFEEYIKEGLISKTLMRDKTSNARKEEFFNESDLYVFGDIYNNKKYNQSGLHRLKIREHDKKFIKELRNKILEKYEDIILDFANNKGLLKLGFLKNDELVVPDFEYSSVVDCDTKKYTIFFDYIAKTKEIKIFCGNNKKEFDITDREYGQYLKSNLYNITDYILDDKKDIIYKNLKNNFDLFKKEYSKWLYSTLSDIIIEQVKENNKITFEYYDFDSECSDRNELLGRFYVQYPYYLDENDKNPEIWLWNEQDISDTIEGKEIIKLFEDTVEDVCEEARDYINYYYDD